ncbi:transporter [Dyella subtropica]|uniref:transporter n=1 Tax=Dyella subtropica TaxID=2992127 RepID=UPI002256960B|nr:transporter [Dyella subtropica]
MDFSRSGRWYRALLPALLLLAGATQAQAQAEAEAEAEEAPGFDRPGLGFSTNPLHAGQFGFEQGLPDWSRHRDAGTTSDLATYDSLLRLGLGSGFELQLGGSPYNRLRQTGDGPSQTSHGRGDTSLSLKWAPPSSSEAWNWGVLGTMEFTDGARNFRSDRRVYTVGAVLDQKLNERTDISYFAQWQRSGGRDNYLLAPDYNYELTDQVGVYLEAAFLRDADYRNGTQAGGGLSWQPLHNLQFDTWFRHRLSGQAATWEAGVGVAMLFGR